MRISDWSSDVCSSDLTDPLLGGVGWSWLTEALDAHDAQCVAPSGTVTSVSTENFGSMEDAAASPQIENRASWTPVGPADGDLHVPAHVAAWGESPSHTVCLEPVPQGVGGRAGRC